MVSVRSMEISEPQYTIALQEAFSCYLACLSYAQQLRQSKLPRQGKDVETTVDLSVEQDFQSRITVAQTSLNYAGRIAKSVRKWAWAQPEDERDEDPTPAVDVAGFETFLSNDTGKGFRDILSGAWIEPTTPFSAGPSNDDSEAENDCVYDKPGLVAELPIRRKLGGDADTILDTSRSSTSIRAPGSLGMHPNQHISYHGTFPDPYHPREAAEALSNTNPDVESENTDSEEGYTDDSEDDFDTKSRQEETSATTIGVVAESHKDNEDDIALQSLREEEHRQQGLEQRRKQQEEQALAQAKEMADRKAREDKAQYELQEKHARNLERAERQRQLDIQRNREAAQRLQEQWELAAIAQETEVMRLEERRRREEEERNGDAERKRKIERERREGLAADAKRQHDQRLKDRAEEREKADRAQYLSEERRRVSRVAQDLASARRRDQEREREREREKRPKIKKADCVSCMDTMAQNQMAILPCDHAYCGNCIKMAFKNAYKSKTPFKCCRTIIKPTIATPFISSSFSERYSLFHLEATTKHPKYCSASSCHLFIPPSTVHGPIASCPSITCTRRTCTKCMKKEHKGVCKEDKEGKAVEALAKKQGWKKCPGCGWILERTEGCLHMTCRCKAEWCYACGREWGICGSTCGRSMDGPGPGTQAGREGIGVIPLVATAVFMALFRDREDTM